MSETKHFPDAKGTLVMHNQLRGDVRISNLANKKPVPASSPKWLPILALVCAVGFVVARFAPNALKARTIVDGAPHPAVSLPAAEAAAPWHPESALAIKLPAADTEDLIGHLDSARAAQKEAAEALRRSQDWVNRAMPSVDDGSLAARRLQLVRSKINAAEAQINRTREELEIAKSILIERSQKP